VCLNSNRTVHAARKTFIAEKKALLSMMSQCLMVSKTKFQHSVSTTFFLHVLLSGPEAHSLWLFRENLIKVEFFSFFFSLVLRMSIEQWINLKFLVHLRKTPTEALKLLQEVYSDDTMSRPRLFWVVQEVQRGKRGGGRWLQE